MGYEALDATHLTWHRLLATSQALYRGAPFEDIRLPSYGGSLFDPARFPFLSVRDAHETLAVTVRLSLSSGTSGEWDTLARIGPRLVLPVPLGTPGVGSMK